ncbi:hypothetical protein CL633_00945 [bacterium]|nr:hypothetical protein [bacterium]|tara:strand:- start:6606 stop:7358 length:753 start_codon:yes stop_codon:yes gene_type:complete
MNLEIINYILLGAIQGIFEWIPVSSEGIVALASNFLKLNINPIDIGLFLHLGTLLSAIIYFRKDWIKIITFKDKKLLKFLLISTAISLILGFFIYKFLSAQVMLGSSLLLITGLGLLGTAFFHKNKKRLNWDMRKLSIITGLLQGLSVIPGLSRSGSTIFGLSLGKFKPEKILKISYLMSVPVGLAGSGYIFLQNPSMSLQAWPGLVMSFLVGILGLHILLQIVQKINFAKFAFIFAFLCLAGAMLGFIF